MAQKGSFFGSNLGPKSGHMCPILAILESKMDPNWVNFGSKNWSPVGPSASRLNETLGIRRVTFKNRLRCAKILKNGRQNGPLAKSRPPLFGG